MKKKSPPREEPITESYVGRGYRKRRVLRVPLEKLLTDPAIPGPGFDRFSLAAETWAKGILERAGFPANGDQLPHVEARGFREFEDDEWFAATILYCLGWVRFYEKEAARGNLTAADFKKAMGYAVRAGGLFRDVKVDELSRGYGKDAPHPSTSDPVIARWVKSRHRANPAGLTLADLHSELKNTDPFDDAIRIGRAKVHLSGRSIKVFENGIERKLALTSLRRYLTEARKNGKTR